MVYLSDEAKLKVLNRKYRGIDDSILVKYVLGPFWDRCILLFPWNLAPNVITLSGFFFMLVATIALAVYTNCHPILSLEDMNNWTFRSLALLYGVSLFAYQIFDNCDGRQARRCGTGSALGELLDHSVDSMIAILNQINLTTLFNICYTWKGAVMVFVVVFVYYTTTWEETHSGVLYLGKINGPDEGLFTICVFQLIFFIFGFGLLEKRIPLLNLAFIDFLTFGFILVGLLLLADNVFTAWLFKRRVGSLNSMFVTLYPSLLLTLNFALLVFFKPSLITEHGKLVYLAYGFTSAYTVCVLMLNYICSVKFNPHFFLVYLSLLLPILAILSSFINISVVYALWAYTIIAIGFQTFFLFCVSNEMSTALGIRVLTCVPKNPNPYKKIEKEKEKEKSE